MKISLLITSFAREKLFEYSLVSILPQLQRGDEIIFIEDGNGQMPNFPQHAFAQLGITFSYCKTGNTKYRGASCAKNIGLKQCKNPLIIINDPEVVHITSCIQTIRDYFEKEENQNDFIVPAYMFSATLQHKNLEQATFVDNNQAPFIGGVMKDKLMEIGGWDERFTFWGNDDNDLMHRLGMLGVHVKALSYMTGYHQWHDRAPAEALGDFNHKYLYEPNKQMVANQGKSWGLI